MFNEILIKRDLAQQSSFWASLYVLHGRQFVSLFLRFTPVGFACWFFFFGVLPPVAAQPPLLLSKQTVLFLDLNNAHEEIAAIKRVIGSSSWVSVIPSLKSIRQSTRMRVRQLGESKELVNKALQERAQKCSAQANDAKCNEYWDKLTSLEHERLELLGYTSPASGSLALLDQLKKFTLQPEILVISGHHENGFFSGELADLNLSQLHEWIQSNPAQWVNLRTVILLGCDTSKDRLMENKIAPIFPHAKLIVGAEGSAPQRHEFRNLKFIEALMAKELDLSLGKNPAEAHQATRKLRQHLWPVAMLWNGQYFAGTEHAAKEPLDILVKQAQAKDPRYKLTP